MRLPLTLACGAYDRTAGLARGEIQPEGVDLTLSRSWLAQSLYKAFELARRDAAARLAETAAGASLLPWGYAEAERTRHLMGPDVWSYGLEGKTETLGTFVRYACEQGLIKRRPAVEELFAAETREEYVI